MPRLDRSQIQVILPYTTLENLLEAPRRVDRLTTELQRLSKQIDSLHAVLFQTIERLKELE